MLAAQVSSMLQMCNYQRCINHIQTSVQITKIRRIHILTLTRVFLLFWKQTGLVVELWKIWTIDDIGCHHLFDLPAFWRRDALYCLAFAGVIQLRHINQWNGRRTVRITSTVIRIHARCSHAGIVASWPGWIEVFPGLLIDILQRTICPSYYKNSGYTVRYFQQLNIWCICTEFWLVVR